MQSNIKNRTVFAGEHCDNLHVMRGMDTDSIDLIATDPPFNSKRLYNAPLGSKASGQKFDDRWRWDEVADDWLDVLAIENRAVREVVEAAAVIEGGSVDRETGEIDTGRVKNSLAAFLCWMAPRVLEMRRILKPTGSLYLHCDDAANAYLRLLLDAVFGRAAFRNEISWNRSNAGKGSQHAPKNWGRTTDRIFYYAASNAVTLNPARSESEDAIRRRFPKVDEDGRRYNTATPLWRSKSMGDRPNLCYEWRGFKNPHPSGWRLSRERLEDEYQKGNVVISGVRIERRSYADEARPAPCGDFWGDIGALGSGSKERTRWTTQKPFKLYERIIAASSNRGDVVFDPHAGCGTTCGAAERLGRRWIGADVDPTIEAIMGGRADLVEIMAGPTSFRRRPPTRTDDPAPGKDAVRKHVYKAQGGRCANPYCTSRSRGDGTIRFADMTHDHRIPRRRGGGHGLDNALGVCGNCNGRKGGAKSWPQFVAEDARRRAREEARA